MGMIELKEIFWHVDKKGNKRNPLASLYYWGNEQKPVNRNYLSFAGDCLFNSKLQDIHFFHLDFSNDLLETNYREEWADNLKGVILSRLADDDFHWYFGYVGNGTDGFLNKKMSNDISAMEKYLLEKNRAQITIVKTEPPFGMGNELIDKIFFEVNNNEIEWVAENVWQDAYESYSIEGYCLPKDSIKIIEKWCGLKKDAYLFQEIINTSKLLFYTIFSEHQHIEFISSKIDRTNLEKQIDYDEVRDQLRNQYYD